MSEAFARRAAAAVLGLSLILGPAAASGAGNPSASAVVVFASEEGAKAFVQGFYDWYVGKILAASRKKSGGGFGFDDALKQRPDWFSPELKRLLLEDVAASSKCKDEVVGLDWDPFLESQENPSVYAVGKAEKIAQGFRVSVDDKKLPKGDHNPVAQADVTFVGGHWTFVDFVQQPTDPKFRQGLIAILKGYEKNGEYKCKP
jgi:hypothetical protein